MKPDYPSGRDAEPIWPEWTWVLLLVVWTALFLWVLWD